MWRGVNRFISSFIRDMHHPAIVAVQSNYTTAELLLNAPVLHDLPIVR